jgi:hypothetical protein
MIFPFGDISVPVACPIGRFDVARETGERVQEIGTADDANKLLAANNRQPLDPMFLHHSHDLIERRLFGDGGPQSHALKKYGLWRHEEEGPLRQRAVGKRQLAVACRSHHIVPDLPDKRAHLDWDARCQRQRKRACDGRPL